VVDLLRPHRRAPGRRLTRPTSATTPAFSSAHHAAQGNRSPGTDHTLAGRTDDGQLRLLGCRAAFPPTLRSLSDQLDLLLPKPVRPLLSPARMRNSAGRGCFVVVRGCPLRTVQDRCEWHACGTANEDDPRTPWRRWLRLDRRVRPVVGDHRLVGKSPEDSRQSHTGT
jgi:hypothetical protein